RDAGFHTVVVPLLDDLVLEIRPVLFLLWGGVLVLLLLGAVNITNLVLTRSTGRMREWATRQALGADRGRIGRQVLTETIVLALAGGALGLVLGRLALRGMSALQLDAMPRAYEVTLDPTGVAVILGLSVTIGVLIGVMPLARLWGMNVTSTLREEGRSGTS